MGQHSEDRYTVALFHALAAQRACNDYGRNVPAHKWSMNVAHDLTVARDRAESNLVGFASTDRGYSL